MKYIFATDEDLNEKHLGKKIVIGKLVRGESVRGPESFELMGETI